MAHNQVSDLLAEGDALLDRIERRLIATGVAQASPPEEAPKNTAPTKHMSFARRRELANHLRARGVGTSLNKVIDLDGTRQAAVRVSFDTFQREIAVGAAGKTKGQP